MKTHPLEQAKGAKRSDKVKLVDVKQAFVGHFQMRDYRQGQEGDLKERFGQNTAKILGRSAQCDQVVFDDLERFHAHQSGDR